ncbi:MAG: glycosyltransferase [Nanoarchaeota archaeon]
MISIIITAYKEPRTIKKAISEIAEQDLPIYEILVVAPDQKTLEEVRKLKEKYPSIRTLQDSGNGKPAALNLAVSKSKGDILILTDGDVYVGAGAINFLLKPLSNPKIGAVSGNPISLDSKKNMLGFWAYMLTNIANERRLAALKENKRIFCSGYLFAIRKDLFPKLPEELLSEDGFISHNVYESGFGINYAEKARVYIKYPTNFADWIKQKKRSAGGYNQNKKILGAEIRSFRKESAGATAFFKYPKTLKEFFWLGILFLSRIYLWFVIYRDINFKKKTREEIWKRVESTK